MSNKTSRARLIAFYLPQFHPIPENDKWWGKGFTEWTNVGKAKPLFKGHEQPKVPADLGYYDLRVPETRTAQAQLAKEYGIEGFCYWHYWFGNGKRLLERPFNEVLASKEPDFPFCLAWANETWKGFEHGLTNRNTLIEQIYPGQADHEAHFFELLPAFKDSRYITVDGKPLFMIYKPFDFPDVDKFIMIWQKLAIENGLKGIYFVGQTLKFEERKDILKLSFDAVSLNRMLDSLRLGRSLFQKGIRSIYSKMFGVPKIVDYNWASKYFHGEENKEENMFPTIYPNWDHTPRSGKEGLVFINSLPGNFEKHAKIVIDSVQAKNDENKIIFIKSWNEWAEGNYLEPDMKYGHAYLEALKRANESLD